MIGHSIGELVCATLAGVFSLENALMLVATRGRLMQALPQGSMLSVRLAPELLQSRLPPDLAIAAINGPKLCVAAGPPEAVTRLEHQLEGEGIVCRHLRTSHAFHSPMMDPIVESFEAHVRKVRLSPPAKPFISTVTASWISPADATSPAYWARRTRTLCATPTPYGSHGKIRPAFSWR